MKPATIARAALLAAAALVVALLVTGRSDDGYELKLRMANTDGLKNGSPVTIGGVRVGTVKTAVDTRAQQAVVTLKIQDRYAPIGRDTRATIVAQNVLGQKQVQLTKGDTARPAASGFVVPAARITTGTDLDRVLDVLDADTRTRLAIFVNEAGTAFTGRKADLRRALKDLGPAVEPATRILDQLADADASLERLVQTSDRYVAAVTARRKDVVRLVDRLGQAAVTGSTKRAELRRTLAEAPVSLATLRRFLAELRATTAPLGPAARQLSAVAGPLNGTLAQVAPFTDAAKPTLGTATAVAPALEQLAAKATPVLGRARGPVSALAQTTGKDLPPITRLTDRSLDNTLAVLQNWAGAIQFRDGLSHIFRGEASIAPDALQSIVNRLSPRPPVAPQRRVAKPGRPSAPAAAPKPASGGATIAPRLPKLPLPKELRLPGLKPIPLPDVGATVDGLVGGLTGRAPAPKDDRPSAATLLDRILGH